MKNINILTVCTLLCGSAFAYNGDHGPFAAGVEVDRIPMIKLEPSGPINEVFSADFNRDGSEDYAVYFWSGGCGLACGYCDITFLLSGLDGYTSQSVSTLFPDPGDYMVLAGRPCLVHASFHQVEKCEDGQLHNFWVYNLIEFGPQGLVLNNDLHPDFPKTVFYSEMPNHRETTLLSDAQKRTLLEKSQGDLRDGKERNERQLKTGGGGK
jgi:hypothetical protein